jgi:hypothetical protein
MTPITLRAHFDGTTIRLDEPYELPTNAPLIVTVLPDDSERADWAAIATMALNRAYSDDEPEYTDADLIP